MGCTILRMTSCEGGMGDKTQAWSYLCMRDVGARIAWRCMARFLIVKDLQDCAVRCGAVRCGVVTESV